MTHSACHSHRRIPGLPRRSYARAGFTLIELSIVLVIIGLIAGGVLIGKDMIEAAKLRKIITQVDEYKTAVYTFKVKYNALPGDMMNATTFWGTDSSCPNQPARLTPETLTCDGNNNGRTGGSAGEQYEWYRFWQHLANAELIRERVSGTGYNAHSMWWSFWGGVNAPTTALGGVVVVNYLASPGFGNASGTKDKNNFHLYVPQNANGSSYNPLFTAQQAYSIDAKIDNGIALSGNVVSGVYVWRFPQCLTAWDTTADYNGSRTDIACDLSFAAGF